jgi:hypothetical protein
MKDILTRLRVEDICLEKIDWREFRLLINESEYADDPDTSEYFNMQGMKVDVESKGYKYVVDFLESFPLEQMMMVKEYVWEQIHENFEEVHAKHCGHIGSAMTVNCFIKICLQKCLRQNKPSIRSVSRNASDRINPALYMNWTFCRKLTLERAKDMVVLKRIWHYI